MFPTEKGKERREEKLVFFSSRVEILLIFRAIIKIEFFLEFFLEYAPHTYTDAS